MNVWATLEEQVFESSSKFRTEQKEQKDGKKINSAISMLNVKKVQRDKILWVGLLDCRGTMKPSWQLQSSSLPTHIQRWQRMSIAHFHSRQPPPRPPPLVTDCAGVKSATLQWLRIILSLKIPQYLSPFLTAQAVHPGDIVHWAELCCSFLTKLTMTVTPDSAKI